jgi:hypothetical protein
MDDAASATPRHVLPEGQGIAHGVQRPGGAVDDLGQDAGACPVVSGRLGIGVSMRAIEEALGRREPIGPDAFGRRIADGGTAAGRRDYSLG